MDTKTGPAVGSNDELGALVDAVGMENWLNYGAASHVSSEGCNGVSQEHLERFAELVRAAERERCAAWVDARRDAFCEEHGSIDPDTGTLEFGRGAHAEAKSEYVAELEEIAAGLRALKA